MNKKEKLESYATVLVSGEGLVAAFHGMREKCHFLDLLDFCTLAEALVLNDQIEIVCDIEFAYSLSQHSTLVTLQDAGVVSTITTHRGKDDGSKVPLTTKFGLRLDPLESNRFALQDDKRVERKPLGTFSMDQILDEATSLLRAERELGISALPMRRFSSLYIPNARVREEHSVCDLMGRYSELASNLQQWREKSRHALTPLLIAQIPPIPVTVLERATTGMDLLNLILEVRDEFSSLRKSLADLRRDLSDQEIPPKEKRKLILSWHQSWLTLNKFGEGADIAVANTTNQLIDVDKSIDLETFDFKLSNLFDIMAQSAKSAYYRWRVRMLHRTAERYLKICDGRIVRDLERIYKREFTKKDLRELQDWEAAVSLMTIDLEGMSPKQEFVIERSSPIG